jgi:hypothetical protein
MCKERVRRQDQITTAIKEGFAQICQSRWYSSEPAL